MPLGRKARGDTLRAAAAAAAACGSIPLERKAAVIPVRTSPAPAVARPGLPEVHDEDLPPGRRDERVGALEEDDGANVVRAGLHRVEAARPHPFRLPAQEGGELALVRGEHGGGVPA